MNESFYENIQRISRHLNKDKKRNTTYKEIIISITSCVIAAGVSLLITIFLYSPHEKFIEKENIQNVLSNVVRNGGSIDEARHIYETKTIVGKPFFTSETDFLKTHYPSEISLSSILSDLIVNYYNQDSIASDSVYVHTLRNMITEYNTIHPFDGLEESQKYYLDNIHQKLDSNYNAIQDDLIKLGEELDRKNILVNKYLDKSELSYKVSIIALFFTLIFSVWQLVQNHKTGKKIDSLFSNENEAKEKNEQET